MECNKGLRDWQNYMFAIRSYSENILSISWPFVISSFSCILLPMVLGILFVNRGRRYRGSLNLGYVPEQISVLKAQKLIPEDVKEDLNKHNGHPGGLNALKCNIIILHAKKD